MILAKECTQLPDARWRRRSPLTVHGTNRVFSCGCLPLQPQAQLRNPRPTARISQGKNAVAANPGGVVRVVEDVEEVDVEAQRHALGEVDELERRCILE